MAGRYPVVPGMQSDGRTLLPMDDLFRMVDYEPWEGQREFHEAEDPRWKGVPRRYRLLCGGARYGKSKSGGMDALRYLMTPGTVTWAVGPTYELSAKEFRYVVDATYKLRQEGVPCPIRRLVDNERAGDMSVELDWSPNPKKPDPLMRSLMVAKSCKEPQNLLGAELDLLLLSEGAQIPLMVWQRFLRPRLGTRLGRVIVPTTPRGLDDFLHPTFYEPALRGDKDYWMGQYGVWDNPDFDKGEIEEARRTLPPEVFAEQYGGQFVSFVGRVYKDFSRATHVIDPFEIPPEWPRWRAIDYGYEDPFACVWVASDEFGRLYVYREHYHRRQILSWHADKILEVSKGERIDYSVIDPSARAKKVETGISIIGHLAELGLPCVQGHSDVEAGIFRMMEWLKIDPASGRPGLMVFSTCRNTIMEFEQHRWLEPKEGRNAQVNPEQKNQHVLDSLRYLVMGRPRRYVEKAKVERFSFRRYKSIAKEVARLRKGDVIGQGDWEEARKSW